MNLRLIVLLGLSACVFGGVVAIGMRHEGEAPLEMSAPLVHRPELEMAGITVEIETRLGPMLLSAGRASVGYEHLGHLRLGIGTHLLLREVVLSGPAGASPSWSLRAREARWTPTRLLPTGRAQGSAEGAEPTTLRDVTVDLESGVLFYDGATWP